MKISYEALENIHQTSKYTKMQAIYTKFPFTIEQYFNLILLRAFHSMLFSAMKKCNCARQWFSEAVGGLI